MMHTLSVEDIGTDPTSALNFVRNRYSLALAGITAGEIRTRLRPTWTEYYQRRRQYDQDVMGACVKGSANYAAADGELRHLDAEGPDEFVRKKIAPSTFPPFRTASA